MSYDLILGQTSRDWSCGGEMPSLTTEAKKPSTPSMAVEDAEKVRWEIDTNANLVLRLMKAKRLPEAERLAFGKFFKKWSDYYSAHRGKFVPRDQLALWNFRKVNQQFGARLAVFETVARTPIKPPVAPSPDTSARASTSTALVPTKPPFRPPGSSAPSSVRAWTVLLGAGLGIAALLTMAKKTGRLSS